jgi:thiamine-monophosphate kinase
VHYERLPKFRIGDRRLERRCVLSGGDDYELIFTARPGANMAAIARALGLKLTCVGAIVKRRGLRIFDAQGRTIESGRGFDHFAK